MAVNWPATLPQAPGSYSEQPAKIIIGSENDAGPLKTRPRFTKAARRGRMTFLLTIQQWMTLDSFFENDLKGGAIAMNFRHPWTLVTRAMYIIEPPSSDNEGPLGVNVSFSVEYF